MAELIDKKTESLAALKNANKHLSEVFADMGKKDAVLNTAASDLRFVATQCGELQVQYYAGAEKKFGTLKTFLNAIAANLDGARS